MAKRLLKTDRKRIRTRQGFIRHFFKSIVNFFIAVGSPFLFLLKICLWSVYWIGRKLIGSFDFFFYLSKQTFSLVIWIHQKFYQSIRYYLNLFFGSLDRIIISSKKRYIYFQSSQNKFKKNKFVAKKLPKIFLKKPSGKLTIVIVLFIFLPTFASTVYFLMELPNPNKLATLESPVTTKIYDRNGILLYEIYTKQNRTIIPYSDIPKYLIDATIAYEDQNFYKHQGIDLKGIVRAVLADVDGQQIQGGSTITQQLIKSTLLSPERTIERKIKEIVLSIWAEQLYTKKDILQMYFNQIPYGGETYGAEAAAETYFGKSAKDLTLAQAALLAGLPSAPTVYSPFGSHPEKAKEQQEQVLQAMYRQGLISKFQLVAAENEPLTFRNPTTEIKAPHFVMFTKDYLVKKYGIRQVEQGGLEVHTSLDYSLYQKTLELLHDGVEKQNYLNVGNGASLIVNPQNGQILTMVGSIDYFDQAKDGNVNVVIANRSPGSSIKPLTFAIALDKKIITASTIIDDSPITYRDPYGPPYSPQNYDNKFHGRVSARTALAASFNIPAVKILKQLGVETLVSEGHKAGIEQWNDPSQYGLSLTLGGGEVSMIEMTKLYSEFANGGKKIEINPIISIRNFKGETLEDNGSNKPTEQIFSPETSFIISSILSDNNARSITFGPNSALVIKDRNVAVKTGTTQEKRDNWTIGYTPSVVTAVWVGNNDNSPMSPYLESGNTGAAAIWNPIMTELLKDKNNEQFKIPDRLISTNICTITGQLSCENCPNRTEYFIPGTEPKISCNFKPDEIERIKKDFEEKKRRNAP